MTRVLIVDDDPDQLRSLARVVSAHRDDLAVTTAAGGVEAVEHLRSTAFDLVLTDIQMPEMNGFELLAWLLSHQPHILVFMMTAYPDPQSLARLESLGNVECFTKPLDVPRVVERLSTALSQSVRGHVRNISLAAFLQLIEMERKTCTLTVESRGRTGYLYVLEGRLFDARKGDDRGEQVAFEIVAWPSPAITIVGSCSATERTVHSPLGFIIMEAMRIQDEASKPGTGSMGSGVHATRPQALDLEDLDDAFSFESDPPDLDCGADLGEEVSPRTWTEPPRSVSRFPARLPADAEAVAIVDVATGRVRTSVGFFPRLEALAELVAAMSSAEIAVAAALDERVEEMVLTGTRHWTVVRPLAFDPGSVAVLVFDPRRANLAMERLAFDDLVMTLDAWLPSGRACL